MKNSKKPGDKELRVSDWLRVKSVAAPSQPVSKTPEAPASSQSSVAVAPAPAFTTTITPPVQIQNNGHHRPEIEPASRAAILDSVRHLGRPAAVEPQRHHQPVEAPMAARPTHTSDNQPLPFDVLRIAGGILARRRTIIFWALTGLVLGFSFGWLRGDTYSASMVLMLRDVPTSVPVESGHSYRPKTFDKPTLGALLTSPALFQRLAPKLKPPVPIKDMPNYLDFVPNRGDTIELVAKGAASAEDAVYNVNLWGQEIVAFTQELQSRETQGTRVYLERQTIEEQINTAKSELTGLRAKYSDANPLIREKVAQMKWLEDRINELDTQKDQENAPAANSEDLNNTIGYFSVVSPATVEDTDAKSRWLKALLIGGGGFLGFLFINLGIALCREVVDRTVRTESELEYTIGVPNIQKIPQIDENSILSASEVSAVWSRIVGASPSELVCFWSPMEHEQPHLVMQSLLNLASKRAVPLVWVETEGATVRPPSDFQEVELSKLSQLTEMGRYRLKLDLHAISAVEADHVSTALVNIASRHRIPVWLGIQGPVQEAAAALARHAHRVKILATLGVAKRDFWKTQSELLKQSVKTPTEWLAVNYVPWYRW